MSASGLPANSSDSAILPMSVIDLAPRKVSRNWLVIRFSELNSKIFRMRIVQENSEASARPIITTLTSGSASTNISHGPRWPAWAPPTRVGVASAEARGVGRRRRRPQRRAPPQRPQPGGRCRAAARTPAPPSSAQARRREREWGWFFSCEASFRQFLLGLARPRTRRDRRAGRLSALDGGGPARTRHRRPRKSKALVATPVPPRFDPISFVGLGSSRFEALNATGRRREPRQVLTALLDLRPGSFGNLKSHRQGGVADRCFATKPRQARRFCNATSQVY